MTASTVFRLFPGISWTCTCRYIFFVPIDLRLVENYWRNKKTRFVNAPKGNNKTCYCNMLYESGLPFTCENLTERGTSPFFLCKFCEPLIWEFCKSADFLCKNRAFCKESLLAKKCLCSLSKTLGLPDIFLELYENKTQK